jgi:hypothetical protein
MALINHLGCASSLLCNVNSRSNPSGSMRARRWNHAQPFSNPRAFRYVYSRRPRTILRVGGTRDSRSIKYAETTCAKPGRKRVCWPPCTIHSTYSEMPVLGEGSNLSRPMGKCRCVIDFLFYFCGADSEGSPYLWLS